jgi:RHH-type proline utilization regulon transcriptional repressor/proline dehydrogenase/delta 1-pyrroline-5-carboxylate dehydrogenase
VADWNGRVPRIDDVDTIIGESIAQVKTWVEAAAVIPPSRASERLAGVLRDPNGLAFTVGFVDGVVRPESIRVAARNLRALTRIIPRFLPVLLRVLISLGGFASRFMPWLVIPVARRALRGMVRHLIIDASPKRLGRKLRTLRARGVDLNINLLGEAVLGPDEASKRLQGTLDLLNRDDVDYVSVKVSSIVSPHSPWAFREAVANIVEELLPLYTCAAESETRKFINLDMEEYHDLDLTITVFRDILDRDEFLGLEAGIVLQAYLPDALDAMIRLQDWAGARRARGGAPIKIRVVKGANLPMERVDAEIHGWELATVRSKREADTNYKRVLNYAFTPARIDNVKIGVAGHNLFDIAFAWALAGRRKVRDGIEFEMLLGMAESQAEAVRATTGSLLLYTPVVHPAEFDVAIAYLIRRLDEGANEDNFMSAVFFLTEDDYFTRETERFAESVRALDDTVPTPHRTAIRHRVDWDTFDNASDTDSAVPANRQWGTEIVSRSRKSKLGVDDVAAATVRDAQRLESVLSAAAEGGRAWGRRTAEYRAHVLRMVANSFEEHRAELIEIAMSETGKTIEQADPEISEAIDFARYYAERAMELETLDGAQFHSADVTLVAPPWNFPIAIPAGSTLAALASGSAVIFKPASQAARCGAYLAQLMWKAGVPRGALHSVQISDKELRRRLITDERVNQVILTGGFETAELFRELRPDLRILAETSGKNAMVITESADLDLAAKDLAHSAFGHAGQKCSAASIAILVGGVASSERFRRQLVDAVTAMVVDFPTNPESRIGPIIEPARGKLLEALTTLNSGEKWLLEPQQLDARGRLWSPGIRTGVKRRSSTHLTEFFGPHLSIMTARNLTEAVRIQNEVDFGLTAGIHSLDPSEVSYWLENVEAGNLYVNRGITGAIVRRQPFGGWKKSAVGPGTKAGGPHYLLGLGTVTRSPASDAPDEFPSAVNDLLQIAQTQLSPEEMTALKRAAFSDTLAMAQRFGTHHDESALDSEINALRYRPSTCTLYLGPDASPFEWWRALIAWAVVPDNNIAYATAVPQGLKSALAKLNKGLTIMPKTAMAGTITVGASTNRVRLVGFPGRFRRSMRQSSVSLSVYDHDITESGHIELLPYFREQSVSITAHRFGNPVQWVRELSLD